MEYIPVKSFKRFAQSAVNAHRETDENSKSSVVAETMNLLANSSYGHQIMDRSCHTVTENLSDEKTQGLSTQICSSVWITSMINRMK